jgi:hypothetical protein
VDPGGNLLRSAMCGQLRRMLEHRLTHRFTRAAGIEAGCVPVELIDVVGLVLGRR